MKLTFKKLSCAIIGLVLGAVSTAAMAADITGAGATFPYPLYSKWADAYKSQTGIGLNYQSIGSGGGIAQIKAKTVTFGASDKPLPPEELEAAGLTQFPTVVGGAVPVVNLPDIKSGDLTLDGDTLAKIYMGEITKWDDAAITKLNPTLALPNTDIVVVHRSDGSGTTFIWTNYLSKVSKAWSDKIGAGTAVEWPVGLGAKGNEGVAGNVQQTAGSIGYVELAYATANKLSYTAMINKDGNKVQPSIDSFAAAAGNADWANAKDFYLILTDQPGENAWPVAGATFILIYKDPSDKVATKQALDFFKWAYENGNDMARDLDYVPLPDNVHKFIEATWDKTINLN